LTPADLDAIRARLEPAVEMLRADGFELEVHADDSALQVSVLATDAACDECLVPKDVFASILRGMLGPDPGGAPLVITYPTDS
jgi:hypothetical protein